jgi:hypothetical protein
VRVGEKESLGFLAVCALRWRSVFVDRSSERAFGLHRHNISVLPSKALVLVITHFDPLPNERMIVKITSSSSLQNNDEFRLYK